MYKMESRKRHKMGSRDMVREKFSEKECEKNKGQIGARRGITFQLISAIFNIMFNGQFTDSEK